MRDLTEKIILEFYVDQIRRDQVNFVKDKKQKKEIIASISRLKQSKRIHEKLDAAKQLWKKLLTAAIKHIDDDLRGLEKLFDYFEEFINFEELLFASVSYYRDHTLHSLWVYFLGEYLIYNDEFKGFYFEDYSEYEEYKGINLKTDQFVDYLLTIKDFKSSIRCISSLTHDLGYPVTKITSINKSIAKILPYFRVREIEEFCFNFNDGIQANVISNFLELISKDMYIRPYPDSESEIIYPIIQKKKNGTNLSLEEEITLREITPQISISPSYNRLLNYSNDFQENKHGIMSAYLLANSVRAFSNIPFSKDETIRFDIVKTRAKLQILQSIANHTSDIRITKFRTMSELLCFVDEIEEFSRTFKNQNRTFKDELCKTKIGYVDSKLEIVFTFEDDYDFETFFKDRCRRLVKLFDISKLRDDLKIKILFSNKTTASQIELEKNRRVLINKGLPVNDIFEYLEIRNLRGLI
ncbi:MAG: hypothetical protein ABRQ23_00170 [Syntrophomonadaceae bacterium]